MTYDIKIDVKYKKIEEELIEKINQKFKSRKTFEQNTRKTYLYSYLKLKIKATYLKLNYPQKKN